MTPLRLIASAAYVGQELAAEFGLLPPAFLPIGVARLYEAQIERLGAGGPVHLSIPEGFAPQPSDLRRLQSLGVVLVPVPAGLTLGESIVYCLNVIPDSGGPLQLLHGDTLIGDLPGAASDVIATHAEGDDYSWAAVDLDGGRIARLEVIEAGTGHDDARPVACGYFALDSGAALVRAITRARGDFIAGLNLYMRERPLSAAPVAHWQDFGHIQSYFRSRRMLMTARSFNALQINARSVRKSSADTAKMRAESAWFASLPPPVLPFAARLLEAEADGGYTTEYQYMPTVAELFVFGAIGRPTWRKILGSCHDFLSACAGVTGPSRAAPLLAELAVAKTGARLVRYAAETGFDIDMPTALDGHSLPSLRAIGAEVAAAAGADDGTAQTRPESLMHGDFCFSNILYNSRSARISVIDPRGSVGSGAPSPFGHPAYDLAKLAHSIDGCYDQIIAGRYALARDGSHGFSLSFEASPHHDWLRGALAEFTVAGIAADSAQVRAITIGLFLSMLPLHADRPDRQAAFVANALRLYAAFAGRAA